MFELKYVTKIDEIAEKFLKGEKFELNKSDITIQNDKYVLQFEKSNKDVKIKDKMLIGVGTFNLEATMTGIVPVPFELKEQRSYGDSKASKMILKEFSNFFDRLDMYEELEQQKKRGILLYGSPGLGKTLNINKAAIDLVANNDTCVIYWNTNSIRSDDILNLFSTGIEYKKDVKKLVIVVEDIGMGVEGYGGSREVDSSLLNLLDGAGITFELPTFFIATTNYAHNLPEPLLRPGRFDNWIEVGYPSAKERVELVEFISKEKLSDEDRKTIESHVLEKFSIAHLKELVIRVKRDGVSYKKVVNDLVAFQKKFNKGFEPDSRGFGLL